MLNKTFVKEYFAILEGILDIKKDIINAPIARKNNSIIERCVDSNGENAITHYEVLHEFSNLSLVSDILFFSILVRSSFCYFLILLNIVILSFAVEYSE